MKVREIMRANPRFCAPKNSLGVAGRIMDEIGAGVLPVVGESERVVGIITDRDICCGLARLNQRPSSVQVSSVMTRKVHSCAPDDDVRAALATMRRNKVRRLPVVDESGALQGLLSMDDVVLEARLLRTEHFDSPLYTDIVDTLREIVRHATPMPAHG